MEHDLFEVLERDHETIKDLIDQLEQSVRGKSDRAALFARLKQELVPHMKAEEGVFYPPLLGEKESRRNALVALEEHHVAEMVLDELDGPSGDDDRWEAKLVVFRDLLAHHIEEEEATLFEDAREVLSDEELEEIFVRFREEKEKAAEALSAGKKRIA